MQVGGWTADIFCYETQVDGLHFEMQVAQRIFFFCYGRQVDG